MLFVIIRNSYYEFYVHNPMLVDAPPIPRKLITPNLQSVFNKKLFSVVSEAAFAHRLLT